MTDPPAIRDVFLQEYARLVRTLSVAFDHESAADAVQDAFVAADRRWAKISRYEDPAGWVRRVAVNKLLTGRRNQDLRRKVLNSVARLSSSPEGDPERDLDLRRAIDALPRQMRLCVCLYYILDLPVDEVATTLSISAGTVKSNLHDGRQRLRQLMEVET